MARTAPPDLVRRLREIVPGADLVYMGEGKWQLGYYQPENSRARDSFARQSLGSYLRMPETPHRNRQVRFFRFVLRTGFRTMGSPFVVQGDPRVAGIPEALRRWDWIYRHRLEEALKERLAEIDDERGVERAMALMQDKVESEGKSIFKHATSPPVYSIPETN